MTLVTLLEKRDVRARREATVPPLQVLRTVSNARPILAATSIHNRSAPPGPARVVIAPASARRGRPQIRTEPTLYRPGPHNNKARSGENIRSRDRVRRAPPLPRLAQSGCAPA